MRALILGVPLLAGITPCPASAQAASTQNGSIVERYRKAEAMLTWNSKPLIKGDVVTPQWIDGRPRFWYRVTRPTGADFMVVDPAANTVRPAFDQDRLAAELSVRAKKALEGRKLPFQTFKFVKNETAIEFQLDSLTYTCPLDTYVCSHAKTPKPTPRYVKSPDGKWEAFVHQYNLYVRPFGGGDSVQLTRDGVQYYRYGGREPGMMEQRGLYSWPPDVRWSPDSKRFVTSRRDERGVTIFPAYSSTKQKPVLYQEVNELPGDSVFPRTEIYVVDIERRSATKLRVDTTAFEASPGPAVDSLWAHGSDTLYVRTSSRGFRNAILSVVDVRTGVARVVVADSSPPYVERGPPWYVSRDGGTIIWYSMQDGWGHLYLYDRSGQMVKKLTSGPWKTPEIEAADDAAGRLFFTGYGRDGTIDPVFAKLYSVRYDGTALTLLTPEDANHNVTISPDKRFIIDTYSRVDLPATTVLRSAVDGRVIRKLETADPSALVTTGWRPPEPFTAKARDGTTDLYGVLFKPNDFDPAKKYPVINLIYPGPFTQMVPKSFYPNNGDVFSYADQHQAQALAQLGFVVIHLDAFGSGKRSFAFETKWHGNMGDNGIPDQIAAMRQLATRYPWFDISRVGIYGNSGGGFASTDAILRYPDFFHVAVSAAGNHDNASYGAYWGERFQGFLERDKATGSTTYDSQANRLLANNLKGKLLLIHGDLDSNVHLITTLQVADALIKANKRFDMFIVPDGEHDVMGEPYIVQLTWDYFVRHLLREEPPEGVVIRGATKP